MQFLGGLMRNELNRNRGRNLGFLKNTRTIVLRAKAFHKKEEALRRLKEKASFRNPEKFYFQMIKTRTVDGVHRPESEANRYTQEELMLMKTQDIGYILQKMQSEKNKIEKLTAMLHSLDHNPSNNHVYYAEDREEAKMIKREAARKGALSASEDIPDHIERCVTRTAASYGELEARKSRVRELEKLYMDMSLQKELQKKGRKRKLHEEEIISPTSKPVYKFPAERRL